MFCFHHSQKLSVFHRGGNVGKETTFTEKKKFRTDDDLQSSLLDPTDRNFIYDAVDDFHDAREHESLQTAIKLMDRKGPARVSFPSIMVLYFKFKCIYIYLSLSLYVPYIQVALVSREFVSRESA